MKDIFGIVQNDTFYDSNGYIKEILSNENINKLKINWAEYLHQFYISNFIVDNNTNIINDCIKLILKEESDIDNINCLSRFIHLNSLFEIINQLNLSYNQSLKIKNYTLLKLQNYYLKYITENRYLLNHWFIGIINMSNYDDIYKTKYYYGLSILKKYLVNESDEKTKFINIYSYYISSYLINLYENSNISLLDVFKKLDKINNINILFFDSDDFILKVINNLTILWDSYLKKNVLENYVVEMFNKIKLDNNFIDATINYINSWVNVIKIDITVSNYGDKNLFKNLIFISPLIIHFKSNNIIEPIKNIYKYENNLLEYIFRGLNSIIKKSYMSRDIINCIALISIYDNKEVLWNLYLKHLINRINYLIKNNKISLDIIKNEFEIFNLLINNEYCNYLEKTRSYLNNIKKSIEQKNIINKCKINYIDVENNSIKCNDLDINKVDYYVIDKHSWNLTYNFVIKDNLYPKEIINYLSIGKTYYDKISETTKIEWDLENSVINYSINNYNIISTVLQYAIIYHINLKEYTEEEFIDNIGNNKSILKSYIDNLIDKKVIIKLDKLKLNITEDIDLTDFTPTVIKKKKEQKIKLPKITMTNECIEYLRLMFITKMFKLNSTTKYKVSDILNELNKFINKYLTKNKLNAEINKIIKNLTNINEEELLKNLTSLEKRDIIEKVEDFSFQFVI